MGDLIGRSPTLAVFAVSVIAIVGGGVLALPIALYAFGPLLAGGLVLVLGLLNVFTIGALATAIGRSNAVASGRGRITSLTDEHLGPLAAQAVSLVLTLFAFLGLIAFTLGLVGSMPELLIGSSEVWLAVVAAITVVLVLFDARRLFVASATVVSVVNLTVLTVMTVLIALQVRWERLVEAPDIGAAGGLAAALALVFGAILYSFYGHASLFIVAQPALQSDPTGRALRRGAIAAMVVATVINSVWVVVCLAVIPAEQYASESSTGLGLLTEAVGPEMRVLGVIFLVLAPGLGALNVAFVLANVLDERLPRLRSLTVLLRPGSAVEAMDPQSDGTIVVSRVGDDLIARGHRGRRRARAELGTGQWSGSAMLRELGIERRGTWVRVDVLGEEHDGILVAVESSMLLREVMPERERHDFLGGSTGDLDERIVRRCIRHPSTVEDLAAHLGAPATEIAEGIERLVARQRLVSDDDARFRVRLGTRRRAQSAAVASLLSGLSADERDEPRRSVPGALNSVPVRRLITSLPIAVAMVAVTLLLEVDVSFASLLSYSAMLGVILLGGGLPLLLNISLGQRAERPVAAGALMRSAMVSRVLFGLFCGICAVYATVIYDEVVGRVIAAGVLVLLVTIYVSSRRRSAFAPRSALLLNLHRDGSVAASAIEAGQERSVVAPQRVELDERRLELRIPDGLASPVLIAALDGEALPGRLGAYEVRSDDGHRVTGRLEDSMGDEIEVGSGAVVVTWQLT